VRSEINSLHLDLEPDTYSTARCRSFPGLLSLGGPSSRVHLKMEAKTHNTETVDRKYRKKVKVVRVLTDLVRGPRWGGLTDLLMRMKEKCTMCTR